MEYLKQEYSYALESHHKIAKEAQKEIDRINKISVGIAFLLIVLFGLSIKHYLGNPYYILPNIF